MDDLISRQAAIEAVRQAVIKGYDTDYGVIDSDVVYEVIDDVPAADVVVPVRCEDCTYHSFDAGYGNYWCNLTSGVRKVKRFDFCSYGERKE